MANLSSCDKHTITLFQKGGKNAFLKLYSHYAPAILGILTRIIAVESQAEECLNRSFWKIWSQRQSYDPAKERLFTWMVKVAMKCAECTPTGTGYLDRHIHEGINLVCGTDIKSYLHQKQRSGGDNFSTCLDPAMRQAIDLIYFKSYSFAMAAEKLGFSVDDLKRKMISNFRQLKQIDTCSVSIRIEGK